MKTDLERWNTTEVMVSYRCFSLFTHSQHSESLQKGSENYAWEKVPGKLPVLKKAETELLKTTE